MAMKVFHRHFLLTVLLSSLIAMVGSSCDISCEGGSWQKTAKVVCGATGSATLTSPARFGLPATLSEANGRSCMDASGGCSIGPEVGLGKSFGTGEYGFGLNIVLPTIQGSASYTLPSPPGEPYVLVSASLGSAISGTISGTGLHVVSGTIAVAESNPSELRISFEMELELPATLERFSITGGAVTAGGCSIEQPRVCVGVD